MVFPLLKVCDIRPSALLPKRSLLENFHSNTDLKTYGTSLKLYTICPGSSTKILQKFTVFDMLYPFKNQPQYMLNRFFHSKKNRLEIGEMRLLSIRFYAILFLGYMRVFRCFIGSVCFAFIAPTAFKGFFIICAVTTDETAPPQPSVPGGCRGASIFE